MNRFGRVPFLVGLLAGTIGPLAVLGFGCSSSSTTTISGPPDAVADSHGADVHATEASVPDALPDHTVVDAGRDAQPDAHIVIDATADSGADVGVDTGFDAGHDAGYDAEGLLNSYTQNVAIAYCQKYASCCGNAPSFDVATCVSDVVESGGIGNTHLAQIDSGFLTFDPAAESACLSAINAFSCATLTAPEQISYVATCASAIKGTLPVGTTGCRSVWDCVQPAYCAPNDAGTGTCAALKGLLSPCTDTEFSTDCTSLGNAPGAFCGPYGATSPHCLASEADGGVCEENVQCNSTICSGYNPDSGLTYCVSSERFGVPGDGGTCGFFPPPKDGGT